MLIGARNIFCKILMRFGQSTARKKKQEKTEKFNFHEAGGFGASELRSEALPASRNRGD